MHSPVAGANVSEFPQGTGVMLFIGIGIGSDAFHTDGFPCIDIRFIMIAMIRIVIMAIMIFFIVIIITLLHRALCCIFVLLLFEPFWKVTTVAKVS